MRKRLSKPKRAKDVSEWAHQMVAESTRELSLGSPHHPSPNTEEIRHVMSEMGRKGGRIGGKRRLETMTAEDRSRIASNAARRRWAKAKRNGSLN